MEGGMRLKEEIRGERFFASKKNYFHVFAVVKYKNCLFRLLFFARNAMGGPIFIRVWQKI